MSLEAIQIEPSAADANWLLLGLHGWGANAADLAALADYIELPHYRMAFPEAPFDHPYAPEGRMWYGFPAGYDFQRPHDFMAQTDLQESRDRLHRWIQATAEAASISLSQTILAGFSQGGAMALDVGLRLPLAGILVLSGYLHGTVQPHPAVGPVLMVHGRQDPIVPLARAQQARDALREAQLDVTYQEFDMGHEVRPAVLQQVEQFCQRRMPG